VSLSVARHLDSIELVVRDDGAGFDCDAAGRRGGGLGLVSMEERARLVGGELVVVTAPGKGTTIRATVPASGGSGAGAAHLPAQRSAS
jgi:signal transduction histidine kinase